MAAKSSRSSLGGAVRAHSQSRRTLFHDGWPLLDAPFAPGERRRLGFVFLSGDDAAQVFRRAGKFYLWEGRFIGEAIIVE